MRSSHLISFFGLYIKYHNQFSVDRLPNIKMINIKNNRFFFHLEYLTLLLNQEKRVLEMQVVLKIYDSSSPTGQSVNIYNALDLLKKFSHIKLHLLKKRLRIYCRVHNRPILEDNCDENNSRYS